MSNVPAELKYSKEHEWLRKEADGTYTVGITEHAQELLGDMVFAERLSGTGQQRPVYRRLDLQDQSQRRSAGCRAAGCRRV